MTPYHSMSTKQSSEIDLPRRVFLENVVGYAGGVVAIALYTYFFIIQLCSWTWWQYILAIIISFDVAGGLVCPHLYSSIRSYSNPFEQIDREDPSVMQILKQDWIYRLIHIHPIIVQLCFSSINCWHIGVFWYLILQLSAAVALTVPLNLQQSISMLLCLIPLIFNYYFIQPVGGFEWLIPALFFKVLNGLILRNR